MNQKSISFLILTSLLILNLIGCDKHKAKRLSGIYDCDVTYSTWNLNDGSSDTSYTSEFEITQDYKHLIIASHRIHVDSIRGERLYKQGSHNSNITVQFKKGKKLDLSLYWGGLGGGSSYEIKGIRQ